MTQPQDLPSEDSSPAPRPGLAIEHLFLIDPLSLTQAHRTLLIEYYRAQRIDFVKREEAPKATARVRGPKASEEATGAGLDALLESMEED